MSFVYDGSSLPDGKEDMYPITVPAHQGVTAVEWNAVMSDIDDIRAEMNSGIAVDIRKHGGSTSLTDNSTALQHAIHEAVSSGVSVVRLPPGIFQFAAGEPKVTIPTGSVVCLVGTPYGGTRLQMADSPDHSTLIQCGVATLSSSR